MPLLRRLDPFLTILLLIPVLASVLPARGTAAMVLDHGTTAAICLLFFLHGAKLAPSATLASLARWRFQLLVLAATFGLFPLLGLFLGLLPETVLSPVLATGFLFAAMVPSTVQSSITFTSVARGNVALAVGSASISNVLGVVLTPLLAVALLGSQVHITTSSIVGIIGQLVLPFVLGQLMHRRLGVWLGAHAKLVRGFDQGSILLVVYVAFSTGVVQGMWSIVPPWQLVVIAVLCLVLLGVVLVLLAGAGKAFKLPLEDRIVLLFCGSKKSQASGLPMAMLLFPADQVGLYVLPLMVFHLLQLFVCAYIARRLGQRAIAGTDQEEVGSLKP